MKTDTEIQKLRIRLQETLASGPLTHSDVAAATGISQGAISNFLGCKRNLNGECALRLDRFLTVTATPNTPTGFEAETHRTG